MIDLTEKRLRELEARIPDYMIKIAEQQKRLDQVFTFPKELEEIRTLCQQLAQGLNNNANTVNTFRMNLEGRDSSLEETVEAQKTRITTLGENLAISLKAIKELKEEISSYKQVMDLQQQLLHSYSIELATMKKALNDQAGQLAQLSQIQVDSQNKVNSSEGKISKLVDVFGQHERRFDGLDKQVVSVQSDCAAYIGRVHLAILDEVRKKLDGVKANDVPKDYSTDIQELKNDVASILKIILPINAQMTEQSGLAYRMKSLETLVNEVCSRLKKFEK